MIAYDSHRASSYCRISRESALTMPLDNTSSPFLDPPESSKYSSTPFPCSEKKRFFQDCCGVCVRIEVKVERSGEKGEVVKFCV